MDWFSIVLAGMALALVLVVLCQPLVTPLPVNAEQLPLSIRLLWPWVRALSRPASRMVSWSQRSRLAISLQQAGWQALISVAELSALRLCLGLILAFMGLFAGSLVDASTSMVIAFAAAGAIVGYITPVATLARRARQRRLAMLRELPFLLDMAVVCVQAGLNLTGALTQAAHYGPSGPLNVELQRALGDMRAGMARLQALDAMAERTMLPEVRSLVSALRQADQLGVSLGPLLHAQAVLRRSERFQRAEKQALEAPVKMLLPMVTCIFPCTFLVIGFPVASRFLQAAL
jgi:tight adherence protein C